MKKYDSLIIGAGPAGVSCAIWLKQLGFNPAIFDKHSKAGGLQLENSYTNTWIASSFDIKGKDVVEALNNNLKKFHIDTFFNYTASHAEKKGTNFVLDNNFEAPVLVLASGTSHNKGGLIERANLILGTGSAVATRNFENKKIAILGGGDSAFENYHFVSDRGAASIKIFARTLKARLSFLESVPSDNVFEGPYSFDEKNNKINDELFDIVLVCYGYSVPEKALLGLSPAVKKGGFVQTDPDCETSISNLFAIGELSNNFHPCCVTAMAEGVVAAKAIQRKLEQNKVVEYKNKIKKLINFSKKI